MDKQALELIRLCHTHAPRGTWAHYWRKCDHMSAWFAAGRPGKVAPSWLEDDLYFSVNCVTGDNPRHASTRVRNEYIAPVGVIYCDFDAEVNLPLQPSITVNSGRGVHAYWLLVQPIDAPTAADLQRRWVARCGADHCATDLARILRVPGTINTKNGATVTVTGWQPSRRYSADELEEAIGQPIAPAVRIAGNTSSQQRAIEGDIPSRILRSAVGDEFRRLMAGDTSMQAGDASRADAALMRMAAYWCDGDESAMASIWRQSALWRDAKCSDRSDYVTRTIAYAKKAVGVG